MITLPNYQIIELIGEGVKTNVYHAISIPDSKLVVIKILKTEYPELKDIAALKHEYELIKNLDIPGVVKAHGFEKYNNCFALVLEEFDGTSLHKVIQEKKIGLLDFCKIGIQITQALGELHRKYIIHKDIKPQNIIVNLETHQVKIIDFSISSLLFQEKAKLNNPNLLEGTIAYMSPEQTGRMNRSIDYRTDFYSLGVTFYEMLTGQLPFIVTDPMELVHCHIAKQPISINQLIPEIPEVVSEIIMKLLSKTAEERYQSALGIKADLEKCLNQLVAVDSITTFPIGQHDQSSQLQIPEKLYGREAEIDILMAAFENVNQGHKELILVAGYSGIGKSALVNEIHKPVIKNRGYFIAGKFEQFQRNIPYASLIQAFQELMQQLLTESGQQLANWRERILAALVPNAQIIIDVIPELELIIGKQPEVPQLGSAEAQNRFNLVMQKFINVFAQKEHPLVVFLDDLQWADLASLKLIQLLAINSDIQYLFLIGAYRDNEVDSSHHLMLILQEIEKNRTPINIIYCQNLKITDVCQLVGDTLKSGLEDSKELAKLIFHKTGGNPFFINQLLKFIHQENLLVFNFITGQWQWYIQYIQMLDITDNVVDLMIGKIQKLKDNTQNIIKIAACIGNRFNLNTLSCINEKSHNATALDIWEALQAGLIIPLSDNYKLPQLLDDVDIFVIDYKFLHDRVQQAAYALIPDEHKKEIHLNIGRLLLKNIDKSLLEEKIFDIANQLNMGAGLITAPEERYKLAALNLMAGRKAKDSTAYESAVSFLKQGLNLLDIDCWQKHYELTLDLHVETVESAYLNTNFEEAEPLFATVIANSKNILDAVKVYEKKIQFYVGQNRMREALDLDLQVLGMLGVSLSQTPPAELKIEELINLPEMMDPSKLAAMRILMTAMPPAYLADPALLPLIAFTMIDLCLQYGNSSFAAYAYGFYGLILCGPLNNIESGYRFGKLSLQILNQFNAKEIKSKVYALFNIFVRHWKEHIQTTIEPLQEGVQSGLDTGDIEYVGYNGLLVCWHPFWSGENLETVEQRLDKYINLAQRIQQEHFTVCLLILKQLLTELKQGLKNEVYLDGDDFNNSIMQRMAGNITAIFYAYLAKSILSYFFKDYSQAVKNAELAQQYEVAVGGTFYLIEYKFYYSLALLALCLNLTSDADITSALEKVSENQQQLKEWADHAPINNQHKYELVEAEKARVLGQVLIAMEYYECAIQGAHKFGYIHEEALAYECAAEFYFSLGRNEFACLYITKAHYGYRHWGASAKVRNLESKYPELTAKISSQYPADFTNTNITTSTASEKSSGLDLISVIKASQTLSEVILLDNLLEKLMTIVIENAGAQTGILLLEKAGNLLIEAKASVDKDDVTVGQSIPFEDSQQLPISVINFVRRTRKDVVLSDASNEGSFILDPYIIKQDIKSIICTSILNQGKLIGILYLENNLIVGAFTADRIQILKLLSTQAAISLENARLYANLEEKIEERTRELNENNLRLRQTLHELKLTQTQLIQTEKMSSLGQMVAGIAHEINNPVSFIHGNLSHIDNYANDLLTLIDIYRSIYPEATPEIEEFLENIDVDFIKEDMPKTLSSMKIGTQRIREIVLTLRNFSRLDEADMKPVDIHEGIESTLLILQSRLQAKPGKPAIEIIKNYAELPKVECYTGQLNQVFMNILNNAIDSLEKLNREHNLEEIKTDASAIAIRTEVVNPDLVAISIKDNGLGMSDSVRQRIFDPFFTTKPIGQGTGLGLSISYQIVVDKHRGSIECISTPGQGAEFIIQIPCRQK
ncbi:trifunctional serine/threonine-protein kinase/ATP-binding protein/sensor histidine kinase [Anabaena sp. FACHB-709]|uniref:histidine kinase n=2 Tax=Nostocaceae TaxID=1162 RepID=A0A1Z4KG80_ANAVA|nr:MULTISPECIES: ATP-binding sensor histidine kinase [Nostocaceae]BAY67883.1 multi-sensor signal transduction multi-kinase [Trichormus variabilis NIES-23]HBW29632.1 serine/threonine protein kinase [Nostoc sp. UBA8866]AAF44653.1 serine/threonine kinase [Nostoc sp. PCC 7120 = FACHB-418]MBD2170026.1 AAA family ATPase [Anabaena cylindrica FACHB-318]MBD2261553.1 AAA family ATPase [Anabaena sp. FACHB-709]